MRIEDIDRAVELRNKLLNAQDLLSEVKDKGTAGGKAYIRIAAGTGAFTDVPAGAIGKSTWDKVVQTIVGDVSAQIEDYKAGIEAL